MGRAQMGGRGGAEGGAHREGRTTLELQPNDVFTTVHGVDARLSGATVAFSHDALRGVGVGVSAWYGGSRGGVYPLLGKRDHLQLERLLHLQGELQRRVGCVANGRGQRSGKGTDLVARRGEIDRRSVEGRGGRKGGSFGHALSRSWRPRTRRTGRTERRGTSPRGTLRTD